MPRYLVERTFSNGFVMPPGAEGSAVLGGIVACNRDRQVIWLHSYVSTDLEKLFCIYDAPNPEAIRLSAYVNELPIDRITEVTVLDPYAYHTRRAGPRSEGSI